ncbi:MAG: Twin-arginine translocation protein TatA [uncultured Nocardioidaceae bacterium]|uniref:Sec-independent protein translocase protein TatA n=1 Tax=uncultured Nocardioidaceae bacterium TaxID=253824 RepID=A0A6J4L4Z1_9ACTN|nr:MAG: Twin-arginine translocation protein TatA [uncultured Nocardioidaceae bacterium]
MGSLGGMEIFLIVFVLVLLFGAKKIPDLARGTGRGLRIFKAETKGLMDEDDATKTDEQRSIESQRVAEPTQHTQPVTQPTYESSRTETDR